MIDKRYCQHCNAGIEFEGEELAEHNCVVPCPHCGLETKLSSSPQEAPPVPVTQAFCQPLPPPPPGDSTEPLRWWRKGAALGDTKSMACLGVAYLLGHNVSQNFLEAVHWLRLAAEKGEAVAQENLGFCYMAGHGVAQDYVEAAKWVRKSAEQGNPSAQYDLGVLYHFGHGLPADALHAFTWWLKAARGGHVTAQNNVGYCYDVGEIVQQDYTEAYKWMSLAAAQGYEGAQQHCDQLAAKMTVEQINESRRRIEDFNRTSKKATEPDHKSVLERLAEAGDSEARSFLDDRLVQQLIERPDIQQEMEEYRKDPDAFMRKVEDLEREVERLKKGESNRERRPIPSEVRREVWRRDQGRCVKCSSREKLEYDHIIPVSKGGSNTARNIELLCESCNRAKAAAIG